jgi:type I restriction enzyme S subunit
MGNVSHIVGGGTPRTADKANFQGGEIPWITPADLSGYAEKYISHGKRNITQKGLVSSSARLMAKGTVLFSSRAPIGYVAIASNSVCTNQGFKSFVLPDSLDSEYVYYYLMRARSIAIELASGTTFLEISGKRAAKIPLPMAPLPQQHRIVEAIESYLTRLDDAVASVERVQHNLKRYRASVLKAAIEGRLVPTEAELAKKQGRTYEPASELLERILVERRRKWIENAAEKARAKTEEKARKAGKPWTHEDDVKTLEKERTKAAKKYKEPAAPDTSNLPNLPEGWCWATLDATIVSGPQNGIYVHKSLYGKGTPILRIDDYQVDWSRRANDLQKVTLSNQDRCRYMLQVQDLLINRVNSPSHLGKSMIVEPRHTPAVFESNMMRLGLADNMDPFFVQAYLSSASGKSRLTKNAKWAVNQASINQGDVGRTLIPLPPALEQKRIVRELNHAFSITEAVRETIGSSSGKCRKLRQSILKWAFEGKLVEQDQNDEPAPMLLERIKAEREAMQPYKRRRTNRQKKNEPTKHDEQLDLLGGRNT